MIILSKEQVMKLHAMLAGNKRLGTHVMLVFLALASSDIGEKELLQWIFEHQQ